MNKLRKVVRFFKNIWYFRVELFNHIGGDYMYSLSMFKRSLESILETMNSQYKGSFVVSKKTDKINRVIQLINRIQTADYYDLALKQLEIEFKSSPAYDEEITFSRSEINNQDIQRTIILSIELEEKDWLKLWTILKNNNYGLRSWWV